MKKLTWALLLIYLLLLIWIVVFKLGVRFSYMVHREVNLVPFSKWFTLEGEIDVMETLLNVVIFRVSASCSFFPESIAGISL